MSWKHGVALAAACLLSAGALSAQERQPDDQQNRARANQQREGAAAGAQQIGAQRGEGRQGQMSQRVDQAVAAMLAVGNYAEIQLGQFASQKSQNPQVKEFAQQMVQDHSQFLQQLQQFLPPGQFDDLRAGEGSTGARSGRTGAAGVRTEGAAAAAAGARDDANPASNQLAQAEADRTRAGQARSESRQQGEQGRDPIWQIHKEAGQKAIQMTKEILGEKQGNEFDKCYIGDQITQHVHMLAKLEASQNHVSPEFQQIIRQGQQKTEQHLKQAQTLAQQLEGQRGAQPGAQPGQPPRGAQPGAVRPGAQPGATRPAQPGAQPAAPRNE